MAILKFGIIIFLLPEIFAASLYQYGQPFSGFFSNQRQPSSQWLNPFFQTQNNRLQNRQMNDLFNSNSFFQQMPFENFFNQKPFDNTNSRSNFEERDQQIQSSTPQYQQESTPSEVLPQYDNIDLSQLFNMVNIQPRDESNYESILPPHLLAQPQSSGVNQQKSETHPQQSHNSPTNLEHVSPLEFMMQKPIMNNGLSDDSNQENTHNNDQKSSNPHMIQKSSMPEEINSEKYEKQRSNSVDETQYNFNQNDIISLLSKMLESQDISGSKPDQMNTYKQNDQIPDRKLNVESAPRQNINRSEVKDYHNSIKKVNADENDLKEKTDLINNLSNEDILSFLSNILGSKDKPSQIPLMINNPREEKKNQHETPKELKNSVKEQSELKNNEKIESKATQTEPIQNINNKQNDQESDENLQKETKKQENNNQFEKNIKGNFNENNATDENDVNKLMKLINNSPNSEAIMSLLTKILGSGDNSSQLPFLINNPSDENDQHNLQHETKPLKTPSNSFESDKNQIKLQNNEPKVSKLNDHNNQNEHRNQRYNNEHVDRLETQIEKPPTAESNIVQSQPQNNQSNKIAVQKILSEISNTVKLNLNGVKAIYEFVSSSFTNSNINEKLRLTLDISQAIVRGLQNTLEISKKTLHEEHRRPKFNSSFDGLIMPNFLPREFDNMNDIMRSFGMLNSRNNRGFNSDAAQFEALLNNSFGNFFNDFDFDVNRRNNFAGQQTSANEFSVPQPLFEEVTKVLLQNPPAPYKDNIQKINKSVPELMKVIKNTFVKEIDDVTHGNEPDVSNN